MEACQPDVEDSGAMNIAITGVGGGTGQAVIRALRRADLPCRLIGLDADAWATGLYQCDAHALVPRVTNEQRYLDALEEIIVRHKIDGLIPGLDVEIGPISRAQSRFRSLGCHPIVSTPELIRVARDKLLTYQVLSAEGIPFVRTMSVEDFRRSCTPDSFPVIVKPKDGAGSVGATVLCTRADFERYQPDANDIVQDYLVPASWGSKTLTPNEATEHGRLRQEDELHLQGIIAPDGGIVGIFMSINVMLSGVSFRICPTRDSDLLDFSQRAFSILSEMGAVGPCNLQGRITAAGPVLYELNPRCTGITAVRAEMGFNECEAALRMFVLGEDPASVAPRLTYSTDTVCLRYVTEQFVPRADIEHSQSL